MKFWAIGGHRERPSLDPPLLLILRNLGLCDGRTNMPTEIGDANFKCAHFNSN